MAMSEAWLKASRDLHIRREKAAKAKAKREHALHTLRTKQLLDLQAAAARQKVSMPVKHTDMAKNTNGWTGPNGHDGIDLITPEDEPLLAMVRSRVARVSVDGWWGNNPSGRSAAVCISAMATRSTLS
jgi:murein DD-endopeptidase MepM/ murein hydrolase activator NlpD